MKCAYSWLKREERSYIRIILLFCSYFGFEIQNRKFKANLQTQNPRCLYQGHVIVWSLAMWYVVGESFIPNDKVPKFGNDLFKK